jgi:uncharacterized protein
MTSKPAWLLLALALLLGGSGAGQAGEGEGGLSPGQLKPRRAEKDYAPFPDPGPGYVTDLVGLLTPEQKERIQQWLWQVESRTGVEIVVVVISARSDYPGAPQGSIEQFARGLFDKYGIGNLPRNDGVLLLVTVKDRQARIELGAGYGRARDGDATRIMDREILPSFRKGDYPDGIAAGVRAIMREFASVRVGLNWPLLAALAGIPALGLIAYSLFKSGKRGWGWVCVGLIVVLLLAVFYLVRKTLEHLPEGGSDSWSPGGFGGGFGGGSSGGGGATGRW